MTTYTNVFNIHNLSNTDVFTVLGSQLAGNAVFNNYVTSAGNSASAIANLSNDVALKIQSANAYTDITITQEINDLSNDIIQIITQNIEELSNNNTQTLTCNINQVSEDIQVITQNIHDLSNDFRTQLLSTEYLLSNDIALLSNDFVTQLTNASNETSLNFQMTESNINDVINNMSNNYNDLVEIIGIETNNVQNSVNNKFNALSNQVITSNINLTDTNGGFTWGNYEMTGLFKEQNTDEYMSAIKILLNGDKVFVAQNGMVGIGGSDLRTQNDILPQYPLHVQGIDSNGISIFADGDVIAFSDKRLKNNISIIEDPIEKIKKINGYTFNRVGVADNVRKAGVLAQEVYEVLPEVVNIDENGYMAVSYGNLSALIIEALKTINKKIDKLSEKL